MEIGVIIFLIAYFGFDAQRDYGAFHNNGWKNKYKKDNFGQLIPAPKNWYYKLNHVKFKEAFFLSTTLLSFITDRFHFMKWCQRMLLFASIGYAFGWAYAGVGFLANWSMFGIFYKLWRRISENDLV